VIIDPDPDNLSIDSLITFLIKIVPLPVKDNSANSTVISANIVPDPETLALNSDRFPE
jgi:hypothetical protein